MGFYSVTVRSSWNSKHLCDMIKTQSWILQPPKQFWRKAVFTIVATRRWALASLTNPMLIIYVYLNFRPKGHRERHTGYPSFLICDRAMSNVFFVWLYDGPTLVEPWYLSTRSTLLCVLCKRASSLLQVWHRSHGFCQHSDLISNTQRTTHTRTNRLT